MEIPINEDIRNFQAKDIGNFSFKQAAFIAAGLGSAVLVYLSLGSMELAPLPLVVIIIFGFFKPYNMSFFTFCRTFMYERAFSPQTYINETDFVFDEETAKILIDDNVEISETMYVIQTAKPRKIKMNKADKARIAR